MYIAWNLEYSVPNETLYPEENILLINVDYTPVYTIGCFPITILMYTFDGNFCTLVV